MSDHRALMRKRRLDSAFAHLFELLDVVCDPEIPVLTLWDLGVLQDAIEVDSCVVVTITPTYSGCPAFEQMRSDIVARLNDAGFDSVEVVTQLSPAWSSDWMDAKAREKLRAYGVAPPHSSACPQCGSVDVERVSEFSATACKALLRCRGCLEPFDQFKAI